MNSNGGRWQLPPLLSNNEAVSIRISYKINVNYGFVNTNISLPTALFVFCLPKKAHPDPVSLPPPRRTGVYRQASPRIASPPLAGQRGQRSFILAVASHYVLLTDNQYLKIA